MDYSVTKLPSVADCDETLRLAEEQRATLLYQRTVLEHQRDNATGSAVSTSAELTAKTAEVASLTALVASLPAGATRSQYERKLHQVQARVTQLTDRQQLSGPVALLGLELDLGQLAAKLAETDAFTAAVQARKAAL